MVNSLNEKKLKLSEQVRLLKILGELLQKGYPLIQAIEFLAIQFPSTHRKNLGEAKKMLIEGQSFIDFAKKLKLHSDILVYLYYAEKHGDLSFALIEGSFMLQKKIEHRVYLKKVLAYPLFLILFLLLILFFFQQFIIPQYEMLFTSFHSGSNSFAIRYIQFIKKLPTIVSYLIVFLSIVIAGYTIKIKKLSPIKQMEKLVTIPLVKKFLLTMNTYEFSMQMCTLLHSGMPIIDTLKTMQNNESRSFLKEKSKEIYDKITNGDTIQEILQNDICFYKDIIFVIEHGMNNSTLIKELEDYAQYLKISLEDYFKNTIGYIQPIILVFISSSIVSIYLAILLPMFQMMNKF